MKRTKSAYFIVVLMGGIFRAKHINRKNYQYDLPAEGQVVASTKLQTCEEEQSWLEAASH